MSDTGFIQAGPTLSNAYERDPLLRAYLAYQLDEDEFKRVDADLTQFSQRIDHEIRALGEEAEANPPTHIPYSAWGERIDEIQTSKAWQKLDAISAEEGLIALGYQRDGKSTHRLHQFAKLYLFHPASAFYTCPLAMTDGAAKLIETYNFKEVKDGFDHITSRDPEKFWTSGQWMTERTGGSDVARTETTAKFEDGQWRLYGVKWFTSATTSQMTMTLARIVDQKGEAISGSRGLSLFCVRLRDEAGKLNNIKVLRLKDKLGTKALPTAELELTGTPATLLGNKNEGVKTIATLFNVTRIYNACTTIASFRNILNLQRDYSQKREAFKHKIIDWPLHARMLARAEVELTGLFMLTFFTAQLLGKSESSSLSPGQKQQASALLRLLTPISKLMTAKRNMIWTSELVEGFGGAGYIEDTGIPRILRDAQVFSIWEGTTNVLSLDTLRALGENTPMQEYNSHINHLVQNLPTDQAQLLTNRLQTLNETLSSLSAEGREALERNARELAFWMGETMAFALVADFGARAGASERDQLLVRKYQELMSEKMNIMNESEQREDHKILS